MTEISYPTVNTTLKEGDYVIYPSSQGNIKCVVLYDNTNNYGIQIITKDTIDSVELGNGTGTSASNSSSSYFYTAMSSYNNAISKLNTKSEEYLNTLYASYARSVGSVPNNKNSESGYHITQFSSSYSGQLRDTDSNYITDYNKMVNLRIVRSNNSYWLASRSVSAQSFQSAFYVRSIAADYYGSLSSNLMCIVGSSGTYILDSRSYSQAIRPVFTLKPEVKVIGGDGTESSPYTLGI